MPFEYTGERQQEVNDVLRALREAFAETLGNDLKGLYLHGSLAMGCFRPWSSDIDLLAVVNRPLSRDIKLSLVRRVMCIAEGGETLRKVEFSVLLENDALHPAHPIHYILHYSDGWHEAYKQGRAELVIAGGEDADLAAHLTVALRRGATLHGMPLPQAIGTVSREDYLKAVLYDVGDALEDVLKQPMYTVLNLCRTLCYLETGLVGSKREGGLWAKEEESLRRWYGVIDSALREYTAGEAGVYDPDTLRSFAAELLGRIQQRVNMVL